MRKWISILLTVTMLASILMVGTMGHAETDASEPVLSVEKYNDIGAPVYIHYENITTELGAYAWLALRRHGDTSGNIAYIYFTNESGELLHGSSGSTEVLNMDAGWVGTYAQNYDTLPYGAYDATLFLNNGYSATAGNTVTFYVGHTTISSDKDAYDLGEDIYVSGQNIESSLIGSSTSTTGFISLYEASTSTSVQGMAYCYINDSLVNGASVKLADFTRQRWTADTLPAGDYKLILFDHNKKPMCEIAYFTVYPVAISVDRAEYNTGDTIIVTYSGVTTDLGTCWLAMYKKGEGPETRDQSVWWTYFVEGDAIVCGGESGTVSVSKDFAAGEYYFVLVHVSYARLSQEAPITITSPSMPKLSSDKTEYKIGEGITLTYENITAELGPNAWLALRTVGNTTNHAYIYLTDKDGNLAYTAEGTTEVLGTEWTNYEGWTVLPAGTYEISLFLNNKSEESAGNTVTFTVTDSGTIQPQITNSITINYTADLDASVTEAPEVKFTMDGNVVPVLGDNSAGQWVFVYENIVPQDMGKTVTADLYIGGTLVSSKEFSIKQYCTDLLATTTGDSAEEQALRALVVAMLNYGAAAQTYFGDSTELVNSDLTEEQKGYWTNKEISEAKPVENIIKVEENTGNYIWESATLGLYDILKLRVKFQADSVADLTVLVDGQEYTEFKYAGPNQYYLYIDVFAGNFATPITMEFQTAEGKQGTTLNYSVNTYVQYVSTTENTAVKAIVHAIYNYGLAAAACLVS